MENIDYLFKIIVIGNASVGKTCIGQRYTNGIFAEDSKASIGVSFFSKVLEKEVKINKNVTTKSIKLEIWDTAGGERYKTITSAFYRGVSVAIIVYGLDSKDSFQDVGQWFKTFKKYNPDASVIVCGNKSDMKSSVIEISDQSIEKLKENKHIDASFVVSAKTGTGIAKMFDHATNLCLQSHFGKKETKKPDSTSNLKRQVNTYGTNKDVDDACKKFGVKLLAQNKKKEEIKVNSNCSC